MRQSTVIQHLFCGAALLLAISSQGCGDDTDATSYELSAEQEAKLFSSITGCDAIELAVGYNDTFSESFSRPDASLNGSCDTWRYTHEELAVDAFAPYLTSVDSAPSRCHFQGITLPSGLFQTDSAGEIIVAEKTREAWASIVREHCAPATDSPGEYMDEGDPCLASCRPGTLCVGEGDNSSVYGRTCEACTTAPCEGFFHAAFCDAGAQVTDANLSTTIFDTLDVEIPAEQGLRQLLQEVMPCAPPFEITLRDGENSVHFLRGHGVVSDIESPEGFEESPDRAMTWAALHQNGEETLYRCDFADSSAIWQSLTLNDDGSVSNFEALTEAWLPYCEPRPQTTMASGEVCLNSTGEGFACSDEQTCITQALRPHNFADRIGFCGTEFAP